MLATPRHVSLITSIVLLAGLLGFSATGTAHADIACPSSGAPTVGNPGVISSPEQLQGLKDDRNLWDNQWRLAGDIDMGGCTWTDHGIGDGNVIFSGDFDGGGHTISGLTIDVPDSYVGLFGYVEGISSDYAVIEDLTFTGDVTGDGSVGGLIGNLENLGQVLNCHTTGNVTSSSSLAGGLIGYIRGYDLSIIDGSSASGDVVVEGRRAGSAGGLIGEANWAQVTDSFASGDATSQSSYAGGFIAVAGAATIERSYSTGNVSAQSEAAGFIGYIQEVNVLDSFSLGSVTYTATGPNYMGVAGFIGYAYDSTVRRSYSIGGITGDPTSTYIGGFMAEADDVTPRPPVTVTSSFWDTETSGQSTSEEGIGKTTAEMSTIDTFSTWSISSGFDPSSIWGICSTANSGYPFLTSSYTTDPCSTTPGRRTTAPPAAIQAVPLPTSGDCVDVDDSSLSWGTGVFGGWGRSWQPWVRATHGDDTKGGWACVRVLEYSLSQDGWFAQGAG